MKNRETEGKTLFYKDENFRSLNVHFQPRTRLITVVTNKRKMMEIE
jgi:hypothetical protein